MAGPLKHRQGLFQSARGSLTSLFDISIAIIAWSWGTALKAMMVDTNYQLPNGPVDTIRDCRSMLHDVSKVKKA